MKKIIKDLKNNKSKGHHKIQNELIKYANNDKIIDLITILIKHMFENSFMPKNFNIGRITPILKDANKSNKMINNIRPITVSDVISNIFEKYL